MLNPTRISFSRLIFLYPFRDQCETNNWLSDSLATAFTWLLRSLHAEHRTPLEWEVLCPVMSKKEKTAECYHINFKTNYHSPKKKNTTLSHRKQETDEQTVFWAVPSIVALRIFKSRGRDLGNDSQQQLGHTNHQPSWGLRFTSGFLSLQFVSVPLYLLYHYLHHIIYSNKDLEPNLSMVCTC